MARKLESVTRERLERELLPNYLPAQRWFGGKGRRIAGVHIVDVGRLEVGLRLLLCEVHYHYAAGPPEVYVLALRWGETCEPEVDQLAPGMRAALLSLIESRGGVTLEYGRLQAFATSELRPVPEGCAISRLTGEQSNTSFQVGDQYILKLIRRLEPGPNPDLEVGRFLQERTSFRRVPALCGWVEYQRAGQEPATLAMLHECVTNDGSAWDVAQHELRGLLSQPAPADSPKHRQRDMFGQLLGQRTGELHLALASVDNDADFRPEPLDDVYLQQVQRRIHEHLGSVLPALERKLTGEQPACADHARALQAKRNQLVDAARPPSLRTPVMRIRCHGDYHLGQVLCQGVHFWIIDFEGEPSRPLAERRAKHPAVKDIAGMLRSFDYAAQAALFEHCERNAPPTDELRGLAHAWRDAACSAFLLSYRSAVRGAQFNLPEPDFTALLNYFLLDKALYELHYELNNRPDWVGIPLRGILDLLE